MSSLSSASLQSPPAIYIESPVHLQTTSPSQSGINGASAIFQATVLEPYSSQALSNTSAHNGTNVLAPQALKEGKDPLTKQAPQKITPKIIEKIKRLAPMIERKELTQSVAAVQCGISRTLICKALKALKENKDPAARKVKQKITPKIVEKIKRLAPMIERGEVSRSVVAAQCEISLKSIKRILQAIKEGKDPSKRHVPQKITPKKVEQVKLPALRVTSEELSGGAAAVSYPMPQPVFKGVLEASKEESGSSTSAASLQVPVPRASMVEILQSLGLPAGSGFSGPDIPTFAAAIPAEVVPVSMIAALPLPSPPSVSGFLDLDASAIDFLAPMTPVSATDAPLLFDFPLGSGFSGLDEPVTTANLLAPMTPASGQAALPSRTLPSGSDFLGLEPVTVAGLPVQTPANAA